jgi:nitroreductase
MNAADTLILAARSFRRFDEQRRIPRATLVELVDLVRRSGSGGNRQPLRYMLFHTQESCGRIFPHTRWAALLKGWVPAAGERPAAYVLVLANKADGGVVHCDAGIAMQNLMLAAMARGIGGCMLGAIDRPKLVPACGVPEGMELLYVVALGYPAEKVVLEEAVGGNIDYYRDAAGVHHVPKRPLSEVLLGGD